MKAGSRSPLSCYTNQQCGDKADFVRESFVEVLIFKNQISSKNEGYLWVRYVHSFE